MNKPDFRYERSLAKKGYTLIIGIDEVGRGAFAGPVVAAAVALKTIQNSEFRIQNCGIDDSKRLSPNTRLTLEKIIKKEAAYWAIAEIGVGTINRIGIGKATEKAMRKAIKKIQNLEFRIQNKKMFHKKKIFLLVDAFHVKYVSGIGLKHQKAIVKGDQKSISIAAASIIAKVHRDRLMRRLSKRYTRYGWAKNKGYGTKKHQQAILKYGISRLHRKQFINTFLRRKTSLW